VNSNIAKRIAAVLGSGTCWSQYRPINGRVGGHTAEMFRLIMGMEEDLRPTVFFQCPDDRLAPQLLSQYRAANGVENDTLLHVHMLPRPRKVGQSYLTSVFTTIRTILWSVWTLITNPVDIIICNGPGICIALSIAVYLSSIA